MKALKRIMWGGLRIESENISMNKFPRCHVLSSCQIFWIHLYSSTRVLLIKRVYTSTRGIWTQVKNTYHRSKLVTHDLNCFIGQFRTSLFDLLENLTERNIKEDKSLSEKHVYEDFTHETELKNVSGLSWNTEPKD